MHRHGQNTALKYMNETWVDCGLDGIELSYDYDFYDLNEVMADLYLN
jgi:hypothetical protein